MCLTCGCMDAHRQMGESDITYEDVERAAKANGRTVSETFEIMDKTRQRDRTAHPQEYAAGSATDVRR